LEKNPLALLEKEYTLLILQYLHLNPNGRNFEQICSSLEQATPSKVNTRLETLRKLGLVLKTRGNDDFEILYALTKRGRYISEIVWDIFRIILNPREVDDEDSNFLDFYR
jgi:DNA-binding HxlR family transcriptional regulator